MYHLPGQQLLEKEALQSLFCDPKLYGVGRIRTLPKESPVQLVSSERIQQLNSKITHVQTAA
jgi:hypothetical protein